MHYYALFIKNGGSGTIFRPLFFEFFEDIYALNDFVIDNLFMIGDSLLAVPNLNPGQKYESLAYFPAGAWFDLRTDLKAEKKNAAEGELLTVKTDLYEMPAVYLRGGKIIFRNKIETQSSKKPVANTADLDNNFDLYVAFDYSQFAKSEQNVFKATGFIPALKNYNSKSLVQACVSKNCFVEIDAIYDRTAKNIKIKFKKADYYDEKFDFIAIENVYLLGLELDINEISSVSYNKYIIRKHTEDTILLNYPESDSTEGKILLEKKDVEVVIQLK
jgi:alpha-glucosidase (family GH31 glycosyl hydrolase)